MKLPSHFYAIVDPIAGHEPVELARTMLDAGVALMQLRLKDAPSRDFLETFLRHESESLRWAHLAHVAGGQHHPHAGVAALFPSQVFA